MFSRRDFIKTMSMLSGALLLPIRWLGKVSGIDAREQEVLPEGAELYGGFLLLPDGEETPGFVHLGREISICQTDSQQQTNLIGENLRFADLAALKRQVGFPLYRLNALPVSFQLKEATLTRYVQSEEVWGVVVCFGPHNPQMDEIEPKVSLSAQVQHAVPCPIWPVYDQNELIYPEKVIVASQFPGILLPSVDGYVIQWIQQDVLYALGIEFSRDRKVTDAIVASLEEI